MSLKSKQSIIFGLLGLICLIALGFFLKNTSGSENSVKILDYGYSVCTLDVPSSSCGSYEVNVQSSDGKKSTYTVAGFDNRKSERYDEITSKIANAKKQNVDIKLIINNEGEIISTHQY